MTRRLAVTGASGQVGRAISTAASGGWEISATDSSSVDVRDWRSVRDWIAAFRPDLVIHAAAMTDVDGCESRPDDAYSINALGTRNVVRAAGRVGAAIVYLSTNFVFDGDKDGPYHEFDVPRPISVYGASKLAGENEATAAPAECYIVRTSMVYDETGRNFVNTVRRLMTERDTISVVDDQTGNPTYSPDLATGIFQLVEHYPPGNYHLVNQGETTWYGWASEVREILGLTCEIERTTAAEFPRAATPPDNGALRSLAAPDVFSTMPDWRDALRRCLA